MKVNDPLSPRLFGYGVLFRAHQGPTGLEAIKVGIEEEAQALARAMARHVGVREVDDEWPWPAPSTASGEWGASVPFGRCGVHGRPLEHVRVYGAREAICDRLGSDGSITSVPVAEGEDITFHPGHVQRLRARPHDGERVLVVFQTEDRTPLLGNAAPWIGVPTDAAMGSGGRVLEDAATRLTLTNRAFDATAAAGSAVVGEQLGQFFTAMDKQLRGDRAVIEAHNEAEQAGSFAAGARQALFDRQQALLTVPILQQIAAAREGRFRFPGMFGAIAPLFDLVEP